MINDQIKNIIFLAQKYPVIKRVGVFGSYARGEQTDKSDIDVLFDYDKPNEDYLYEILDYGDELATEFGKINLGCDYISYKGIIEADANKAQDRILSETVWIYER